MASTIGLPVLPIRTVQMSDRWTPCLMARANCFLKLDGGLATHVAYWLGGFSSSAIDRAPLTA